LKKALHQSALRVAVAELLTTPFHGLPEVITTVEALSNAIHQLSQGHGPYAVDAERASGFRYSARAYLIQIKRTDGGLHLIDPIAFGPHHPLFLELNSLWSGEEVILHASTQDLPCLRELGLNPTLLFDTELGGRLAGLPRVGLGALVESLLDISLAKEHSAQDWSIRPLPIDWLNYAALDVELLVDLRDEVEKLLEESGKLAWAQQEFAAILAAPPASKREEPWRRTSGSHKIKKRGQLTVLRDLWLSRDALAAELDIAQGRLLSDLAISTLALASETSPLTTKKNLEKVLRPIGLRTKWMEQAPRWLAVIDAALSTPESEQPQLRTKSDALPAIKIWRDRFPEKYIPLSHARFALAEAATALTMPVENLLTPELARRICWNLGGAPASVDLVATTLAEWGARQWQIAATAPLLSAALSESQARIEEPEADSSEEESSSSS
jgi:ribonuclease D